MARIRTVKPEVFTHEELFDSEKATGLPLRLAYIGLWTQCDRDGRFLWRPRQLKTDILPYDDEIDFSRVLDALWTRGFLVKYASDGNTYGCIPSWSRHQFINNREKNSDIPEPSPETIVLIPQSDACSTRDERVLDATEKLQSGRGKEGERKGRGKEDASHPNSAREFDRFWTSYPHKVGKGDAVKVFPLARRKADLQTILDGLDRYKRDKPPDRNWCNPATWLNQERWLDQPAAIGPPQSPVTIAYQRVREKIEDMTNGNNSDPRLRPGNRPLLVGVPSPQAARPGNFVGATDDAFHGETEGIVAPDGSPGKRRLA